MVNDPRIANRQAFHYTPDQLKLFASPGYTFFRDLQPGDTFTLGTRAHHGGWFTVAFVRHDQSWVSVDYVNRNGDQRRGYKWRYSINDACLLQDAA
jgi:hypothetical protein